MIYRKFDELNSKKLKVTDSIELFGKVLCVQDIINRSWLNFGQFMEEQHNKLGVEDWEDYFIGLNISEPGSIHDAGQIKEIEYIALIVMAKQERINIELNIDGDWTPIMHNPVIINLSDRTFYELDAYIGIGRVLLRDDDVIYLNVPIEDIKKLLPAILNLEVGKGIETGYDVIEREDTDIFSIGCKTITANNIKKLQKTLAKL